MSLHNVAVPTFVRILTALSAILDKAAAHAEAKKIEPATLRRRCPQAIRFQALTENISARPFLMLTYRWNWMRVGKGKRETTSKVVQNAYIRVSRAQICELLTRGSVSHNNT